MGTLDEPPLVQCIKLPDGTRLYSTLDTHAAAELVACVTLPPNTFLLMLPPISIFRCFGLYMPILKDITKIEEKNGCSRGFLILLGPLTENGVCNMKYWNSMTHFFMITKQLDCLKNGCFKVRKSWLRLLTVDHTGLTDKQKDLLQLL